MVDRETLRESIVASFETMSPQLRQAARYILEHPDEVALVSMRELARHAGVKPATMTRLAKFLGLAGYEELRDGYAQAVRLGGQEPRRRGFAAGLASRDAAGGSAASRADRRLGSLGDQLERLRAPEMLEAIGNSAALLAGTRRVYVLGRRSCHALAWHFHYVLSLLGERSVHLDAPGGTGGDALSRAQPGDVLLAFSVHPYTADTLALVRWARERGCRVIAVTDSPVSPLATFAEQVLVCPTGGDSFFHTLTPALAVSEALCALLAEADTETTRAGLASMDEQLAHLDTFVESTHGSDRRE
ncbi:MurR/RpiR family transcriptional regulator [Salinicola aestuarinus]|uniref:MurR/RpiR family transcriptional regulator n=1 Tax=Salinicola aestuarinus TaxID=1949082 RepID=UPI000DA15AA1|nr:MurR/RpiR family transcriptional regulator [Salinicola aestuarinus]